MLVVSIVGKDVYQDHIVICTLDDIHNIDKVRNIIFNKYNIAFSSEPTISKVGYYVYDLAVWSKDIRMVVESAQYICDDSLQ